jgi:uncharacterized membrane protein (DUF485 family)
MNKIVIYYGLISGAFVSAIMAGSMAICAVNPDFEGNFSVITGFSAQILALSVIYFAVKKFRDKLNEGKVTFGKAFAIGLLISLIASSIYVLTWAIEYKTMYPDFLEKYTVRMISQLKASGATQAAIDTQISQMKWYKDNYNNPIYFILLTAVEIFPTGVVVSLVYALILMTRKKKEALLPGQ